MSEEIAVQDTKEIATVLFSGTDRSSTWQRVSFLIGWFIDTKDL